MNRLYFFTMYNLSEIQKGIQSGHAALRYAKDHGGSIEYAQFMQESETWIVLNGGTSETMRVRADELCGFGVKHSCFREIDLNGSLSAIAFLVDEKDYVSDIPTEFGEYLSQFKLA